MTIPTRRWFFPMISVVLAASAHTACAQPKAKPPEIKPFAKVVEPLFPKWDRNSDGIITADEADRLVIDETLKGEPAAAAAAIKLTLRSTKVVAPPLTKDYLLHHAGDPMPRAEGAVENVLEPGKKDGYSLESRYKAAARKIRGSSRSLFLDPTPDLDKTRQGALGDCFFVSVVGAMVHRDSASIVSMITKPDPDTAPRSLIVTFPNHDPITVTPPTDAEIALTSSTGDEGVWLAVLEKAFGQLRANAKPEDERPDESTDAIAHGGTTSSAIQALTGHGTDRVMLSSRIQKQPDSLKDVIAAARTKLKAGIEQHRLMAVGTPKSNPAPLPPLPPGVSPNHAFAVLGFDPDADTVRLWNPHGNTFTPKGEPGLQHGYPTKAGIFTVSTFDFVHIFRGLTIETDSPPKPQAPRRAGNLPPKPEKTGQTPKSDR